MKKNKIHYVPRKIWDRELFTTAACTPWLHVETYGRPKYCNLGSTYRKHQVTCENCRRTKLFRGIK